jgi:hypothetical protein
MFGGIVTLRWRPPLSPWPSRRRVGMEQLMHSSGVRHVALIVLRSFSSAESRSAGTVARYFIDRLRLRAYPARHSA